MADVGPKRHRLLSPVLIGLASVSLLVGELALYADFNVFDADTFGDHAVSALEDEEVREYVSSRAAQAIVRAEPDLIGAQPILEGVAGGIAGSGAFDRLFRGAVEDLHRTIFERDRDTLALKLADVGVLVVEGLRSLAPRLARDIPKGVEPRLLSLSSGGGGLAADGARIAEDVSWASIVALALALALFAAAVAVSSDRRQAALRSALAVSAVGAVAVIAFEVGRALLAARFDDSAEAGAAQAVWDSFLVGFRTWNLALTGCGLVVAAAAASLIRPIDVGARLRRGWATATATPATPWRRALRAVALLAAGVAIVAAPDAAVRLAIVAAGALVLYAGVAELLRMTSAEPRPAAVGHRRVHWRRTGTVALVAVVAGAAVVGLAALLSDTEEPSLDIRSCNGSPALCDRTIDEVAFPSTHNSMSAADQQGWLFAQHEKGIRSQLDAGIRGLLIDTHYGVETDKGVYTVLQQGGKSRSKLVDELDEKFVAAAERLRASIGYEGGGEREVYLCHGYCELGALNAEDALGWVKDFLVAHPYEVLLVSIEDDAAAEDAAEAFADSGLLDLVWRGDLAPDDLPTLRELIAADQRVIVMVEDDPGDVPWMHEQFELVQETPYEFGTPAELAARRSCRPNRGDPDNPIFLLNNWVETTPAPRPSNAQQVNAYGTLLDRARTCRRIRGLRANLVAVDFYEEGDVFRVTDQLNSR